LARKASKTLSMSRSLIPSVAGLVRRLRLAVNRKKRYPVLHNVSKAGAYNLSRKSIFAFPWRT
jgi:hypothetical protein